MTEFSKGDRVIKKPAWAHPDVLQVHYISEDGTFATCGMEKGSKFVVEDIPLGDLEPAPPSSVRARG